MMSLLVVVLCYDGDQDQVQRQLPLYQHHGAPVLALSPEDAPANIQGVANRSGGLSGWKGAHVAHKLLLHWKMILEEPQDWFLMHEPDTLCLRPDLPDYIFESEDVFWCINPQREGGIHSPPWFCHRKVLKQLVAAADEHIEEWNRHWGAPEPDGAGMGNSEMMSTAVYASGVEWNSFPEYAWTYKEGDLGGIIQAVQSGAYWLHGMKTAEGITKAQEAFWNARVS